MLLSNLSYKIVVLTSGLLKLVFVTMTGFSSVIVALFPAANKDGVTSSMLSSILLQSDVLALLVASLETEQEISTPLSSASFLMISLKSSSKWAGVCDTNRKIIKYN